MTIAASVYKHYIDSNEPPMERHQHLMQMLRLIYGLQWLWSDRSDCFVSGNVSIYFNEQQFRNQDFRAPDFFAVKGCTPAPERRSWVVWLEDGKYPDFILEILFDSTASMVRGEKIKIYQNIFRTPEYFLYDPDRQNLEGYRLVNGAYQLIACQSGLWWSQELALYLGIVNREVRFFDAEKKLILLLDEVAKAEKKRADRLAEKLRSMNINLEDLE